MPNEWRLGWKVLVSATLGMSVASLAPTVLGIVMGPLHEAYGWSRALVSSSLLITCVAALPLSALVGRYVDRIGARPVALAGLVAISGTLVIIALSGPGAWSWILAWLLYAIANAMLGPVVWASGITHTFEKIRGLALAIMMSANGLALFVVPPIAVVILRYFGWRWIYVAFAVLVTAIYLPLAWAWYRGNESKSFLHAPEPDDASAPSPSKADRLRAIVTQPAFWIVLAFALVVSGSQGTLMVHVFPILVERGSGTLAAASLLSVLGVTVMVSRLSVGVLLDRFSPELIIAVAVGSFIVTCVLLLLPASSPVIGPASVILLGIGNGGTANALAYLVSHRFGTRDYGTIFGATSGVYALGYGVSPMIAAHAYDILASYTLPLTILTATSTVGIILVLVLHIFYPVQKS